MSLRYENSRSAARVGQGEKSAAEPISVSAAMSLAKGALEGVVVRLIGEVSEVSIKSGYKAAYFSVKDKKATLPCMMWNDRYTATGVRLAVGQLIELTGRFSLYATKGRMNFEVSSLSLAGEGVLRQQVADLARKLDAEGLMSPARKRTLPALPERIGLVTSPRGAAVHDVLRTIRRRFPLAHVLVAGMPVEGKGAALGIIRGIETVYAAGAEMVLVVRGGGSFEDLMPFNDEGLARALAACPVPVITGIGHEPDTTIADMVADLRASTPTAAAEAATPSRESLESAFTARARTLASSVSHRLERERARVARCADRPVFQDGAYLFAAEAQTLDLAAERLSRALPVNLERDRLRLETISERLRRALPLAVSRDHVKFAALKDRMTVRGGAMVPRFEAQVSVSAARINRLLPLAVSRDQAQLVALRDRLVVRGKAIVPHFEFGVGLAAARLHDLSPLAILGRGYAIARSDEGAVVKRVDETSVGSRIEVMVSDGELTCEVKEVRHIETVVDFWEE